MIIGFLESWKKEKYRYKNFFLKKSEIFFSLCERENRVFLPKSGKKEKKTFDFKTLFNINLTTASQAVEP